MTFYVLFVIDLPTRRICICGITPHPDESWMLQMSRNHLDPETGCLREKRLLIVDRDTKYSTAFRLALEREYRGHPSAFSFAEHERLRRALRPIDQGRVRLQAHFDRSANAAPIIA